MALPIDSSQGRTEYIRYILRRLRAKSPGEIVSSMVSRTRRWIAQMTRGEKPRGRSGDTYHINLEHIELERRIEMFDAKILEAMRGTVVSLADLYTDHWFDLLGSGWVQVRHGMRCQGLEGFRFQPASPVAVDLEGRWLGPRINRSNCDTAQRLWRLIENGYEPIDWQLDFKSGYRWSEKAWYEDVPLGFRPGRDVKVPWELARCQHGVILAWAFALTGDLRYSQAFRNQLLDFMANNPPKYGVNWRSTMDVAIRIANWLVAYDLFRSAGAEFDQEFTQALAGSVQDHGAHIVNNLDWKPQGVGNHYLADIVGLAFVAAYLPRTQESDSWLALAIQELIAEVGAQFGEDGGHFEGSTSYHRLCAEMAVYGTALVLGLPQKRLQALEEYDHQVIASQPGLSPAPLPTYGLKESAQPVTPFPPEHMSKLERMAEFAIGVSRPDGLDPQIGDNDSGRFIQAHPPRRKTTVRSAKAQFANLSDYSSLDDGEIYWVESHGDHRHVVAAVNALYSRPDFEAFAPADEWLDSALVRFLSGNRQFVPDRSRAFPLSGGEICAGSSRWTEYFEAAENLPGPYRRVFDILLPDPSESDALVRQGFPTFGLYVFRSNAFYLAVRCGSLNSRGTGGHAHNDQLSISLMIGETVVLNDPGSYLYTPSADVRDSYRSIRAHNSPQLDRREPGGFGGGFFLLPDAMGAECLYFGPRGFVGRHFGFGVELRRLVIIEKHRLKIVDHVVPKEKVSSDAIEWICPKPPSYSPGYGVRLCDPESDNSAPMMNDRPSISRYVQRDEQLRSAGL